MLRISKQSQSQPKHALGIHGIWSYRPETRVPNAWFGEALPRKFERHTGIRERRVTALGEVGLATEAIRNALSKSSVSGLENCKAIVLACPALIPQAVARRQMSVEQARGEQASRVAYRLKEGLIADFQLDANARVIGINGFCSGYAKAMKWMNARSAESTLQLNQHEFALVITANCISRITNYDCPKSGGLFGDFASVSMLTSCNSQTRPPRLELLDAEYLKQSVNRSFFNFDWQPVSQTPFSDGKANGQANEQAAQETKLVFSLDGMGIADTAPRAMAEAAKTMAENNRIEADEVDWIIPHQAGDGIVRLTSMKLEQAGFSAEPVNGLTADLGNVSSGSVPMALEHHWHDLYGTILCPVAAVGAPGRPEVSQGCILLKGPERPTQLHADVQPARAA